MVLKRAPEPQRWAQVSGWCVQIAGKYSSCIKPL
uniref:Uncharacterized protein n=1 Tax=Rhizophora mucronata TaxID=61149 RepID=A0A2P2IZR2_RHIMU